MRDQLDRMALSSQELIADEVQTCLERTKTIRIEPALNIPRAVVDQVLEALDGTRREVAHSECLESVETPETSHQVADSRLGSASLGNERAPQLKYKSA